MGTFTVCQLGQVVGHDADYCRAVRDDNGHVACVGCHGDGYGHHGATVLDALVRAAGSDWLGRHRTGSQTDYRYNLNLGKFATASIVFERPEQWKLVPDLTIGDDNIDQFDRLPAEHVATMRTLVECGFRITGVSKYTVNFVRGVRLGANGYDGVKIEFTYVD